jgi:hypothetical protein
MFPRAAGRAGAPCDQASVTSGSGSLAGTGGSAESAEMFIQILPFERFPDPIRSLGGNHMPQGRVSGSMMPAKNDRKSRHGQAGFRRQLTSEANRRYLRELPIFKPDPATPKQFSDLLERLQESERRQRDRDRK